MTEDAKKFLEEVSKSEELKAALAKAFNGKYAEAAAKLAKAHGYDLTPEDFSGMNAKIMSKDELKAVAGGGIYLTAPEDSSSAHNRITGLNADKEKDGFIIDYCFTIAAR